MFWAIRVLAHGLHTTFEQGHSSKNQKMLDIFIHISIYIDLLVHLVVHKMGI